MSDGKWVIGCYPEEAGIDSETAGLVGRLVSAVDRDSAGRLSSLIELRVAPPRGGMGRDVLWVVRVVGARLPSMHPSAQAGALALLSQVGGSLLFAGEPTEHEVANALVLALPFIAGAAQVGDVALKAEFVDFASLCAAIDHSVVPAVSFCLRHMVDEVGGAVGAAAAVELEQLSAEG